MASVSTPLRPESSTRRSSTVSRESASAARSSPSDASATRARSRTSSRSCSQRRPLHGLTVPMLSYDLHVHPAPSVARRWGDGLRVWQAAAEAGVLGFVWKAHEEHTVARCRELPAEPVRAFGSASLNPWAGFDDVTGAIEAGALWLWGPTQDTAGAIGWERPLPRDWSRIVGWLREFDGPLVLATAHLGAEGRAAFAELAAGRENLVCSVTHSLYVPLEEARVLAASGCV